MVCWFGSPGLRLRYVYLCFLGLFPPPQSGGARPTDVTFPLTFLHTRNIAQPCLGPRLAARRQKAQVSMDRLCAEDRSGGGHHAVKGESFERRVASPWPCPFSTSRALGVAFQKGETVSRRGAAMRGRRWAGKHGRTGKVQAFRSGGRTDYSMVTRILDWVQARRLRK